MPRCLRRECLDEDRRVRIDLRFSPSSPSSQPPPPSSSPPAPPSSWQSPPAWGWWSGSWPRSQRREATVTGNLSPEAKHDPLSGKNNWTLLNKKSSMLIMKKLVNKPPVMELKWEGMQLVFSEAVPDWQRPILRRRCPNPPWCPPHLARSSADVFLTKYFIDLWCLKFCNLSIFILSTFYPFIRSP